ncbi:MAG: acetyl/propionyl/methylcrotonyl-CoA carboxylase subunit alpha [Actinomycetota bacterium]
MPRISKLLVANRGEIAVRLFRACSELSIRSVAVYSEADRDALHTSFADEAYLLGEAVPVLSYLNIGKILEVAVGCGADAVHPGYGFLAENPRFAEAVLQAGLIWVGPPPGAIAAMGDKVTARRTAGAAGVASVPGTTEPVAGPTEVEDFGAAQGWPVALKAAHGGGGRGFRVIRTPKEAAEAFESAAREAQAAFGNSDLYLERYLDNPRHVEIQVVGDLRGNLIHLGERDCSLQRRHQKLVEEAPSPALDPALRAEMGGAAVRVAEAAGYSSAGTVEFLLEQTDAGPRFWFLEMNTRLQVEHPVTEAVVGIDLVKEMLGVAQHEPLSLGQDDVAIRGHAVECRINAEDPAQGFLPSPGRIAAYAEPAGPGVRVDAGVTTGSEVPQAYDSLIAKLICWGRDREEAISRTLRALAEFHVGGIRTTIPFHRLALSSDWFRKGSFSTQTVEAQLDLSKVGELPDRGRWTAGGGDAPGDEENVTVEVEGRKFEVVVVRRDPGVRGRPRPPRSDRRALAGVEGEIITAPMQGTIVKTLREEGATVAAGEPILVLEAMKMENLLVCHRDGVLTELRVRPGDAVNAGAELAVVGPPAEPG